MKHIRNEGVGDIEDVACADAAVVVAVADQESTAEQLAGKLDHSDLGCRHRSLDHSDLARARLVSTEHRGHMHLAKPSHVALHMSTR